MQVCPVCAQENPDGFRHCGMCGAALAAAPAREERKVVTVLFTDLVGFTSRAERLDPEDVRATLSPYYSRLRAEIERHGGTVEKFIGDAVMAVFGAPFAHEDDPERAVRAALAVRAAIDDLNAADPSLELQIRTAVTTGEALVALGARPAQGEAIVSGDVVNTAARLQGAAPVGGILVGEGTYRATRHEIEYRDAPPVVAKGKQAPVPVWEAVAATSRFGIDLEGELRTPLIGRTRELSFLTDALARCRSEQTAQLVTLAGVPGIGKSRLVGELFQIADADPELINWRQGRSLPYGESLSYWALGEIGKAHAGILETDGVETASAKLAATLEELFADAATRAWVERHLQPLVGIPAETDATGDRSGEAFSAWRTFLEALAEQRPLVLVFEDLHWADDGLLDFVDYLADWVAGVPMLIVGTARPELLERRPGWGGGKRNASTVSIAPLSAEETARLLASMLDQALLPADAQTEVLARAEGNPLYAEEYVRMLQDRGFLVHGSGGWRLERRDALPLPETVQGIIAARVDALAPAEKQLLQDAAVVGKVFWPSALAAIGGRRVEELEDPLHALERKELLRRDRRSTVAGETQYTFMHLLVRDVAYGQIPRAGRVDKHRRAAEWIASLSPDRSEDRAEMLAHHYRAALALADAAGVDAESLRASARTALAEAAERAEALHAWPAARELAGEALALTPADDPLAARLELRKARGEAFTGVFDTEGVERARDGFLAAGDVEAAAEAEAVHALIRWYRGEGEAAAEASEHAVDLISEFPTSSSKVWVFAHHARRLCLGGHRPAARELAGHALEMAEQLGRDDYAAHALNTIGMARVESGDDGGIVDLERSFEVAERSNALFEIVHACNNLANELWSLGRLDEATACRMRAEATAERFGLATAVIWQEGEAAYDAELRGEYLEVIERVERFFGEHPDERLYQKGPMRTALALALAGVGRTAEALAESERALALGREAGDPQSIGPALLARGWAFTAAQRAREAGPLLDEILAEPSLMVWLHRLAPLPLLLVEQGRGGDYVAAAERLERSNPWRSAGLAAASGDLAAAADAYGRIGSRFVEAWARLLAAERGEVDDLAPASAYFARLGASPYVHRCETLLSASA